MGDSTIEVEPINLEILIDEVENANSSREKGKTLETLIAELFTTIPGIKIYRKNIVNIQRSEEIDIVLWNEKLGNGLSFLPNILLIECKNWNSPIGSREISVFKEKLVVRSCDYGFFIAANGITGDSEELSSAHNKISSALQAGIRIIVITLDEIKQIHSVTFLLDLIKEKICQLVARGTSIEG